MTSWVTNKFGFVYKRAGLDSHRFSSHTYLFNNSFKKWHTITQKHTCNNKPRTLQQVQTTIFDDNHLHLLHQWVFTALLWLGKIYLPWQEMSMHVNYASSLKHNSSKECHPATPTAHFEPICHHHYLFLIRLPLLFHNVCLFECIHIPHTSSLAINFHYSSCHFRCWSSKHSQSAFSNSACRHRL